MTDLERLKDICDVYIGLDNEVKRLEVELKEAKENFNRLRTDVLPEMFFELELSELKLRSGEKIIVTPDLTAAIKPEDRARAHAWLEKHGFGGLIKTNIDVSFSREDHDLAALAVDELQEKFGDHVTYEQRVHPGTLRAFIKEQMSEGAEIPMDLFNVFPFNIAKLERKKS